MKKRSGYGTVWRDVLQIKMTLLAKLIYSLLATYQGGNNHCFPSLRRIANDLNISRVTVIKGIRELEKRNIITVERGKNSNKYYLTSRIENEPLGGNEVVQEMNLSGKPRDTTSGKPGDTIRVTYKSNNKEEKKSLIDFLSILDVSPSPPSLWNSSTGISSDSYLRYFSTYGCILNC